MILSWLQPFLWGGEGDHAPICFKNSCLEATELTAGRSRVFIQKLKAVKSDEESLSNTAILGQLAM